MRNTWGKTWGEGGYAKVLYGANMCGESCPQPGEGRVPVREGDRAGGYVRVGECKGRRQGWGPRQGRGV